MTAGRSDDWSKGMKPSGNAESKAVPRKPNWKRLLHEVIFEADTPAGKAFDILLIVSILASVAVVLLDSIGPVRQAHGGLLYGLEWFFTLLFTLEYLLRLICVGRPLKYAVSFFGIVDLLAIVPTYLSLVLPGSQYLLVIRILRILRIFRILKLVPYLGEAQLLVKALRASSRKIAVFVFTVLTLAVIFGSLMYVIESETSGFTSIPRSIYWAIVTLTTVGYGDISPQTGLGQVLASMIMILGYGIIAVPTGIVTVEMSQRFGRRVSTQSCPECSAEGHDADATYCKYCGTAL
jgi:voltage-gated potassium channel